MPLQELNEPQKEKKKHIFFVKVVGCWHGLMKGEKRVQNIHLLLYS